MPKNEETLKYFKRYSKFYLQGDEVCWRVEAIDWISTPDILEVVAVEYYANETEDDIENGIAGGLIVKPIDPNSEKLMIKLKVKHLLNLKRFMNINILVLVKQFGDMMRNYQLKWRF